MLSIASELLRAHPPYLSLIPHILTNCMSLLHLLLAPGNPAITRQVICWKEEGRLQNLIARLALKSCLYLPYVLMKRQTRE